MARHEVRYLFAGGMAVLAHGYLRTTMDIDIVVGLSSENIRAAFRALESVGYRPRQPITAEQFADEELRESWRREKHMLVLQFWADDKPGVMSLSMSLSISRRSWQRPSSIKLTTRPMRRL